MIVSPMDKSTSKQGPKKRNMSARTTFENCEKQFFTTCGVRGNRNTMKRNGVEKSLGMSRDQYIGSVKRSKSLQRLLTKHSERENNIGWIDKEQVNKTDSCPNAYLATDESRSYSLSKHNTKSRETACSEGSGDFGRQGEEEVGVISKRSDDDKLRLPESLEDNILTSRGRKLHKSVSDCTWMLTHKNAQPLPTLKRQRSLDSLQNVGRQVLNMQRLPSLVLNGEKFPLGFGSSYGVELETVTEETSRDASRNGSVSEENVTLTSSNRPVAEDGSEHRPDKELPTLQIKNNCPPTYVSNRIERSDTPEKIANIVRRGPRPRKESIDATANQNWILTRQNAERLRKFEKIKEKITITLPENDPLETIDSRLQEVRDMIRPKRKIYNILDHTDEERKQHIMDLAVTHKDEYTRKRRRGWRPIDLFRYAGRVVLLVIRCIKNRKKYRFEDIVVKPPIGSKTKLPQASARNKTPAEGRSSLGAEMLLCLTTQPRFRTPAQVKRIRWMLRAAKAFKSLFPAEMETELAKRVAYEKYDDGRVIGCQGRPPDRFYYILSGRVNILTQYDLSTGVVTKSLGYMTKSMTTDPEELEKQWSLQSNLITKGQVEVLVLDKADFYWLTKSNAGPPLDFLRTLDLFSEFPCEKFLDHLDAIESKYYIQNKMIIQDSNRTPWLYVIKSGIVKVVRIQSVIDTRQDTRLQGQTTQELGCGKSFSHADTMLGLLGKQRRMKTMISEGSLKLPEIPFNSTSTNPFSHTLNVQVPETSHSPDQVTREDCVQRKQVSSGRRLIKFGSDHSPIPEDDESVPSSTFSSLSVYKDSDSVEDEGSEFKSPRRKRGKKESSSLPPLLGINIPVRENPDDFEPHALWLTREKTNFDAIFKPKKKTNAPRRRTFLQLDELKTGDVFGLNHSSSSHRQGLDHMHETLASEGQGVSLVSDGAEVIKISKRFFLQNAGNNTMLKVDTMYKEYMTEQEASKVVYTKETWDKYRSELWTRMTGSIKRTSLKRQNTFL